MIDRRPKSRYPMVVPSDEDAHQLRLSHEPRNIRTPSRSIASLEFQHTTDDTNEVARRIVAALERIGGRRDQRRARWLSHGS